VHTSLNASVMKLMDEHTKESSDIVTYIKINYAVYPKQPDK
jgi:hypothetical protein